MHASSRSASYRERCLKRRARSKPEWSWHILNIAIDANSTAGADCPSSNHHSPLQLSLLLLILLQHNHYCQHDLGQQRSLLLFNSCSCKLLATTITAAMHDALFKAAPSARSRGRRTLGARRFSCRPEFSCQACPDSSPTRLRKSCNR